MEVEIIAIGNEILEGTVVNSNAAFISKQLALVGFTIKQHLVLPDDEGALNAGLANALQRNVLVIATGGLGPTTDDITRKVAADLFESDWSFHEGIAAVLKDRYGDKLTSLEDQATVPSKAKVLANSVGTAPGLIFSSEEKSTLILLPGVPVEMKAMLVNAVIPYLQETFFLEERVFTESIHFCMLTESAIDQELRRIMKSFSEVSYGSYPSQGIVSIKFSTVAKTKAEAQLLLSGPKDALLENFSEHSFEAAEGKIEEAIHQLFIENNLTLALAESCTGGAVAARLTSLGGSSKYFLGSIVSYCNELKAKILNVSLDTLENYGAVSEETAGEMLQGVLEMTLADFGVAVTGVAGPQGGSSEKPVGTICIALGKKGGGTPQIFTLTLHGNREAIITRSVNIILSRLWMMVK
ncbi:MAG: nicotinamide-nucleotide amidase [Chlamydiales bacterium]|jgi:nicotinamide-nucleotide amidase